MLVIWTFTFRKEENMFILALMKRCFRLIDILILFLGLMNSGNHMVKIHYFDLVSFEVIMGNYFSKKDNFVINCVRFINNLKTFSHLKPNGSITFHECMDHDVLMISTHFDGFGFKK